MVKRFLNAQETVYSTALQEIKAGQKKSHWMWYIFPQLAGLGDSYTARYYAIQDKRMAYEYWKHPILRQRLLEISKAVYRLNAADIETVFGYPDYLKFQSCMTLFMYIAPSEDIFRQNLERYFGGESCRYTESHL